MMIALNINKVRKSIAEKCGEIGRNPSEVTLIAVSKTQPVSAIQEAIETGVINFGENKAQDFRQKILEISDEIIWHFIGHLQTNKVKYVTNAADFIHSVDSLKIAEEIRKRAETLNKVQNVLLQIYTSYESTKFGLSDEGEIKDVLDFCRDSKSLNACGLMTMAPFTDNEDEIRRSFRTLREIKEKYNSEGYQLKELSMGMTSDYLIAIEEGATMVRVGSAIFGERKY